MAKCSSCGNESARVRSRWDEKGTQLPDECPSCSPGSFDAFQVPSDKKIWMGWEAHPNEYRKIYPEDGGVAYVRKRAYRAEQEAKLALPATDEREATNAAQEKKRASRRTQQMDASEHLAAVSMAREIAEFIEQSAAQGTDVGT